MFCSRVDAVRPWRLLHPDGFTLKAKLNARLPMLSLIEQEFALYRQCLVFFDRISPAHNRTASSHVFADRCML